MQEPVANMSPSPNPPAADEGALPAPDPAGVAPRKRRPGGPKRPYSRSGLSSMKRAIRVLGRRTIDMRTATGKWLTARCEEYARDLGGDEALSQQQRTIIRLVVFDELVLQSGQAWLMRQDALVSARRRAFLPVVRELTQLGESIARKLSLLGLGRAEKPVEELEEYLARRQREAEARAKEPPMGDGGGGDADGEDP